MTDDILDIAKWEQKYPFLDKVLDKYKEFNKPIQEEDTSKNNYDNVCYQIISRLPGNIQKHKPYCMKLIRNLGHYSYNTDYFNPTFDHCDILYNWLYHSSKSEGISDNIIEKCFSDYNNQIIKMTRTYRCSYDSYKNIYSDPIKINILNIFHNNMENIKNILIGPVDSYKTHCQKFVCECANIYREMYRNYCSDPHGSYTEHKKTCEHLDSFKTSYMQFFYKNIIKNDNVPSLEKVEAEYMLKCKINQPIPALTSSEGESASDSARLTRTVTGYPGISRTSEAINEGDRANSLSSTVSTALGTVAGTSSLLALLYKFSPGRNLLRSGFRGSRGKIDTNFYAEGPSELLYDGMEHNDFNSYSIGYEAI